jgi:RimJ/RimL family protein N-acetyltransferase
MTTPRLETERLVLRGFRADDLSPVADFFADPEATRFVGGVASRPRAHTILSAFAGHWALFGLGQWAVEEKASGTLAGFVGHINPPDWPEPEIGWTIFPAFQKRGYASEASRAARAGIARLGGPARIVSYIDPANKPSIRVAEKLDAVAESEVTLRGEKLMVWRHPDAGPGEGNGGAR